MNMHINGPGMPQDALYIRTPVTPEEAFQAIGQLRKEARDEIDRLIRFLDKTDDYVARELEEGADDIACDDDELEPSFSGGHGYGADELEADDVIGGDAEAEPSLGSLAAGERDSQTGWSEGNRADLEGEHDGAEPENEHGEVASGSGTVDDEPSLCGVGSHEHQGFGNDHDGELEPYPCQKEHKPRSNRIKRRVSVPDFSIGLTLTGVTEEQKAAMRPRLTEHVTFVR